MPCTPIQTPGGFGIACSRGRQALPRCYQCRKAGQWLCDYQTAARTTCDRPICRDHGQAFPGNLDYCQEHAALMLHAEPAAAPAQQQQHQRGEEGQGE